MPFSSYAALLPLTPYACTCILRRMVFPKGRLVGNVGKKEQRTSGSDEGAVVARTAPSWRQPPGDPSINPSSTHQLGIVSRVSSRFFWFSFSLCSFLFLFFSYDIHRTLACSFYLTCLPQDVWHRNILRTLSDCAVHWLFPRDLLSKHKAESPSLLRGKVSIDVILLLSLPPALLPTVFSGASGHWHFVQ